jgi:hypothetical protein
MPNSKPERIAMNQLHADLMQLLGRHLLVDVLAEMALICATKADESHDDEDSTDEYGYTLASERLGDVETEIRTLGIVV